jgi:hypothetical protein
MGISLSVFTSTIKVGKYSPQGYVDVIWCTDFTEFGDAFWQLAKQNPELIDLLIRDMLDIPHEWKNFDPYLRGLINKLTLEEQNALIQYMTKFKAGQYSAELEARDWAKNMVLNEELQHFAALTGIPDSSLDKASLLFRLGLRFHTISPTQAKQRISSTY